MYIHLYVCIYYMALYFTYALGKINWQSGTAYAALLSQSLTTLTVSAHSGHIRLVWQQRLMSDGGAIKYQAN